jgi:purine-nucleoside phosphorylase
MAAGEKLGQKPIPGALYSSDVFYDESKSSAILQKLGVLAVEMEGAALYLNAAKAGKNALVICSISDNPFTGEGLRQLVAQMGTSSTHQHRGGVHADGIALPRLNAGDGGMK